MQKYRSFLLVVTIAVIILGIWLASYLIFFQPNEPDQKPFVVTISGTIQPNEKILEDLNNSREFFLQRRPSYIFLFKDFYNRDQIFRSTEISEPVNITWLSDTYGTFRFTFSLDKPVNVVLTYSRTSCTKIPIELNREVTDLEQDVLWDYDSCTGRETTIQDTIQKEEDFLERSIGYNIRYHSGLSELNKSQILSYYDDLGRSAEEFANAKREGNQEKKYSGLLISHFYMEKAFFKSDFYNLYNCVQNYTEIVSSVSGNYCYRVGDDLLERFNGSKSTLENYDNYENERIFDQNNIENIKTQIRAVQSSGEAISIAVNSCISGLNDLKSHINSYKKYCEDTRNQNDFLTLSLLAFIPLFSLVVGFVLEKWQVLSKLFNKISIKLSSPKIKVNKFYSTLFFAIILIPVNFLIYNNFGILFTFISMFLTSVAELKFGSELLRSMKSKQTLNSGISE